MLAAILLLSLTHVAQMTRREVLQAIQVRQKMVLAKSKRGLKCQGKSIQQLSCLKVVRRPWGDRDHSKHSPTWRLYICLEKKTTEPKTGQVTLDLAKLGTPLEQTWGNSDSKEKLYSERLNEVVLNYTYTTELSDEPAKNYGVAYGSAAIDIQSVQRWEVVNPGKDSVAGHTGKKDYSMFKTDHG